MSDGRTGTVVLAPCRLVEGSGINITVLAGDVATAEADAETVKARLLGLEDDGVSAVASFLGRLRPVTRRGGGSSPPPLQVVADPSPDGPVTCVS